MAGEGLDVLIVAAPFVGSLVALVVAAAMMNWRDARAERAKKQKASGGDGG